MTHVGFFLAPVPTANKAVYLDHSRKASEIFKDLGALQVVECWGTDVPEGEVTSLPMAVKLEDGETVVAGWIRWPSKDVADAAMAKMRDDPRMAELGPMPFDGKRLIFGGFDVIMEA